LGCFFARFLAERKGDKAKARRIQQEGNACPNQEPMRVELDKAEVDPKGKVHNFLLQLDCDKVYHS
jgi:hypothetical protein